MENKQVEMLLNDLGSLREDVGEKSAKHLNINLMERLLKRLGAYSQDCKECEKYFLEVKQQIKNLKKKHEQIDKAELKEHRRKIGLMITHLQREHELVTDGYFMSSFMLIGSGVGLVFGMFIFNNPAVGLPIGLCIGLAIGAALDANSKKKGKTI